MNRVVPRRTSSTPKSKSWWPASWPSRATAIAMGKELFYRQREMGIEAAYQLAGQTMAVNMMDRCAQEGVTAFTEKRKPATGRTDI